MWQPELIKSPMFAGRRVQNASDATMVRRPVLTSRFLMYQLELAVCCTGLRRYDPLEKNFHD